MDPVVQLEAEWLWLRRGPLRGPFAVWRRSAPELAPFADVEALLAFLHAERPERTDAPLAALLALAASDGGAARVCLQAILPALKAQARRLRRSAELHDELWALLLAHAWEAICSYPRSRRSRVAANLTLQVLHETSRALRRGASPLGLARGGGAALAVSLEEARELAAPPPRAGAESLLAGPLRSGALRAEEAELILATRLDGVRLRELARASGVGYELLRKRRQRAEARLRAALD